MRGEAVRAIIVMLVAVGMTVTAWAVTYTGENFSFQQPQFQDGDTLISCNCQQEWPHTKFAEGVRGMTFRLCNTESCDLPPDANLDDPSRYSNTHWDSVPVLTITAVEYNKRQADAEAARLTAEATVSAQAVKTDTKTVTIAGAIADADARKAVAVNTALATLTAACVAKDKVSLEGCMPKQNPDKSWTYWRRVRVP